MLDFTQARVGGGISVRFAAADIHALTAGSVEEMRAANPERRIALRHAGVGTGQWDADRVTQALGNIIGNAASHSPKTSTSELLPVLFEPFKQGKRHFSENKSIGLGLYIVHNIIRTHHGEVAVTSNEDGTVFTVRLPRTLAPSAL